MSRCPYFERRLFISGDLDYGLDPASLEMSPDSGCHEMREDEGNRIVAAVKFPEIRHASGSITTARHRSVAWKMNTVWVETMKSTHSFYGQKPLSHELSRVRE